MEHELIVSHHSDQLTMVVGNDLETAHFSSQWQLNIGVLQQCIGTGADDPSGPATEAGLGRCLGQAALAPGGVPRGPRWKAPGLVSGEAVLGTPADDWMLNYIGNQCFFF